MNRVCSLAVVSASLMWGCARDMSAPAADPSFERPKFSVTILGCDDAGVGDNSIHLAGGLKKPWSCGTVIQVSGPASRAGDIQAATAAWSGALKHISVTGMPRPDWTPGTGQVQVVVIAGPNPNNLWCGAVNDPPANIFMYPQGHSSCTNNPGDFLTILTHEMSHVMGYNSTLEGPNVVPGNCALYLPASGSICQHEIEYLYAAYFPSSPVHPVGTDFWSRRFVTGLQVTPTSVTVQATQTAAVTANALLFGRQIAPSSAPLGGAAIQWSNDFPAISSVNSGVITGLSTGNDTVRAKVTSGLGTYKLGTVMSSAGQPIPVTVTAGPPPGTGFRVTAITGAPHPITSTPNIYSLTASVTQQPAGTLQIKWKIVYSNFPSDTIRVDYGPNSYALNTSSGSYSVRVYATPRSGSGTSWVYGAEGIQDFPVCTGGGGGGGGDLVEMPVGEDNDAVAGC